MSDDSKERMNQLAEKIRLEFSNLLQNACDLSVRVTPYLILVNVDDDYEFYVTDFRYAKQTGCDAKVGIMHTHRDGVDPWTREVIGRLEEDGGMFEQFIVKRMMEVLTLEMLWRAGFEELDPEGDEGFTQHSMRFTEGHYDLYLTDEAVWAEGYPCEDLLENFEDWRQVALSSLGESPDKRDPNYPPEDCVLHYDEESGFHVMPAGAVHKVEEPEVAPPAEAKAPFERVRDFYKQLCEVISAEKLAVEAERFEAGIYLSGPRAKAFLSGIEITDTSCLCTLDLRIHGERGLMPEKVSIYEDHPSTGRVWARRALDFIQNRIGLLLLRKEFGFVKSDLELGDRHWTMLHPDHSDYTLHAALYSIDPPPDVDRVESLIRDWIQRVTDLHQVDPMRRVFPFKCHIQPDSEDEGELMVVDPDISAVRLSGPWRGPSDDLPYELEGTSPQYTAGQNAKLLKDSDLMCFIDGYLGSMRDTGMQQEHTISLNLEGIPGNLFIATDLSTGDEEPLIFQISNVKVLTRPRPVFCATWALEGNQYQFDGGSIPEAFNTAREFGRRFANSLLVSAAHQQLERMGFRPLSESWRSIRGEDSSVMRIGIDSQFLYMTVGAVKAVEYPCTELQEMVREWKDKANSGSAPPITSVKNTKNGIKLVPST